METYCANCGEPMEWGFRYLDRLVGANDLEYFEVDICPACADEMYKIFERNEITLRRVSHLETETNTLC